MIDKHRTHEQAEKDSEHNHTGQLQPFKQLLAADFILAVGIKTLDECAE